MSSLAPSAAALLAAQALVDRRLAKTPSRASQKRLPKRSKPVHTGGGEGVYDAVTGKAEKMPGRAAVEKRLRAALKRLGATHETGLALSRALDVAELADVPTRHPLVERCATALASWEGAQP